MTPKGSHVTLTEFANSIQNATAANSIQKIDLESAIGMADHILGFFGYQDRIIDNVLSPEDRNLFYMLNDYELIRSESEETDLWDGRAWRIHFWKMDPNKIYKLNGNNSEETKLSKSNIIYEEIPDNIWPGIEEYESDDDWFLRKF
jgi:hypothetical protein